MGVGTEKRRKGEGKLYIPFSSAMVACSGLIEASTPWYRISDLEMSEMSAPMKSAVAMVAGRR